MPNNLTPEQSLNAMQQATNEFYKTAIATNCHAFIEFTGLMNEYINSCREFQRNNPTEDFRQCNVHTGKRLSLESYQVDYIHEKLTCIYQQNVFQSSNHSDDVPHPN